MPILDSPPFYKMSVELSIYKLSNAVPYEMRGTFAPPMITGVIIYIYIYIYMYIKYNITYIYIYMLISIITHMLISIVTHMTHMVDFDVWKSQRPLTDLTLQPVSPS